MDEHEPHLPKFKICNFCHSEKSMSDFHSKGCRRENICKVCSNSRKKRRRIQKKIKERRRRQKGHTLLLGEVAVVGSLNQSVIDDFGRIYASLIVEVRNEIK